MENKEIARVLEEIADLLEIQDANPFRIRAYRNGAWTVAEQSRPIAEQVAEGVDLTELPSIGKDLAGAIVELVKTGELQFLETLTREIPYSILEVKRLPGIGPKKARRLWEELGIASVDDLENAAQEGRIASLKGFGAKTEASFLRRIARLREREAGRESEPTG